MDADSPEPEQNPRRKWRRRALVALGVVGLSLVCAAGGLLWLLGNLQTPLVRDRVREELQSRFGVEADYDRLSVSIADGVTVRGLSVASPKGFQGKAPELARLGDLEVGWDIGALLHGGKRVERLHLRGVRLAVIYDRDSGRSSVQVLADGLPKSDEPEPPPAEPVALSGRLAAVQLPPGVGLGDFELSDVELTLLEVAGGEQVRTVRLAGVELGAKLDTSESGFVAELSLSSSEEGIVAVVAEPSGEREFVVRPALTISVDSAKGVVVEGRIDLIRQSFDDRLPKQGGLVDLKVAVDFVPTERRTHVRIERLNLLDGAGTMTAELTVLDGDAGTIESGALTASAVLALGKLMALAPEGMVPAALDDGQLRLDVVGLKLDASTFMPTAGSLKLHVQAQGLVAEGAKVKRLELHATADKPGETYILDVAIKAKGLAAAAGAAHVRLADAKVDLAVRDLLPVLDDPLASKARTKIRATFTGVAARTPQGRVDADKISLTADASDPWRPPYGGALTVPIEGLSAHGPKGKVLLAKSDGRIAVTARDVLPTRTGSVDAELKLGSLTASLQATSGKALTYSASVDAPSLGIAKPFAPPKLGVRLDKLGVMLRASGTVRNPFRPNRISVNQKTDLVLTGLSIKRPEITYASPRVALSLVGSFDLAGPRADLKTKLKSAAGPDIDLDLKMDFDKRAKRLVHDLALRVSGLAGVKAMLPPELDVSGLTVDLTSKGATEGVIKGFKNGTKPILGADPLASFRGNQVLGVRVEGLKYADGGTSVASPRLDLDVDLTSDDDGVSPEIKLASPSLTAAESGRTTTLSGLALAVGGRLDSLADPRLADFRVDLKLASAKQAYLVGYPVGGLFLAARGHLERDRLIRIDSFNLRNEAASTAMDLSGTVEMAGGGGQGLAGGGMVPGREAIEFEGALSQDLESLRRLPWFGDARGELGVRLQASSGDRQRFRVAAMLSAEGVDLELPEQGISLKGVDGALPVLQEVLVDKQGDTRLVMGARTDAWSRSRFQDVHPFLSGDSYLSIRELTVQGNTAGPLAGNARVDRNLIAVDQLQAKVLGGNVSGQLLLDTTPKAREVRFRGAVTGVQPTSGKERLDANTAIVLRPDTLSLEGRVQLVRIGRQHLLDLLDLIDPFAEDVAINRARLGLQVGYPEKVRLRFSDGFLTASLKLGGLAGLAKIDDIRGVPLGPPLQRFLGPLLAGGGG